MSVIQKIESWNGDLYSEPISDFDNGVVVSGVLVVGTNIQLDPLEYDYSKVNIDCLVESARGILVEYGHLGIHSIKFFPLSDFELMFPAVPIEEGC